MEKYPPEAFNLRSLKKEKSDKLKIMKIMFKII